jgi:N-acetylglucosaminyldiphosphoundecaprenol N-acetyl-beta-D-mannosaminyltransferase
MERQRVELCGARVHVMALDEAAGVVLEWASARDDRMRYAVTPNVHHMVLLSRSPALRGAYDDADLVLADGVPVLVLARLLGVRLPGRAAGSDLVPLVFSQARPGLRVFLLGAGPGVADRAAAEVVRRWPHLEVVGVHSPPMGFAQDVKAKERMVDAVNRALPDLLVVGLGVPAQECWVHRHRDDLRAGVAVCAGATIDFLSGLKERAPLWAQRAGLEWAHRVLREPRRLGPRYVHDGVVFPRLAWQQLRAGPAPLAPAHSVQPSALEQPGEVDLRAAHPQRSDLATAELVSTDDGAPAPGAVRSAKAGVPLLDRDLP